MTCSKNIYIYWGLHFSTLKMPASSLDGRNKVFRELIQSFSRWAIKVESTKSDEVRKNSVIVLEALYAEILRSCPSENRKYIKRQLSKLIDKIISGKPKSTDHQISNKDFIEYPIEIRSIKSTL